MLRCSGMPSSYPGRERRSQRLRPFARLRRNGDNLFYLSKSRQYDGLKAMPATVRLNDIVDALEMQIDESSSFLDCDTGQVVTVSRDLLWEVEESGDGEALVVTRPTERPL